MWIEEEKGWIKEEIVVIMGPSGGGKTTLVKLLLWLYDPIYGESFKINLSMGIVICQMHLIYQVVLFYILSIFLCLQVVY